VQCSTDWAVKPSGSWSHCEFIIYLFRLEFFSGFNFTTAQVVCITAMINYKLISFSAVQIYDLSYIRLHSSTSSGILRTHNVTSSQMPW